MLHNRPDLETVRFVGVHEETVSSPSSFSPSSSSPPPPSSAPPSPNDTSRGGNRVTHYSLKRQDGSLTLAVVGTERNFRHVSYAIQEEFMALVGVEKSDSLASKWRSKREVVEWLKSFTRKEPSFHSVEQKTLGYPRFSNGVLLDADISGFRVRNAENEVQPCGQNFIPTREILWVGKSWTCHRRFLHYYSFQRNGVTISINSFVYVMSEGGERHIAYIEDLYEDKKCQKKVRVCWFHKTDELIGSVPPPVPNSREIFMTPFPQVLSVECLDGGATVLTPEHYEKCLLTHSDFAAQVHLCYRQFDNDGIKPFDLSNVKGYWNQQALTLIGVTCTRDLSQSCDLATDNAESNEEMERHLVTIIKRGPRGARSSRRRIARFEAPRKEGSLTPVHDVSCDIADVATESEIELPSASEGEIAHLSCFTFNPGDKVEILCEDSGMRGCWFRCVILKKDGHIVKVKYEDLESGDDCGKLQEYISLKRVAGPDKLGIRPSSRLAVRPARIKAESLSSHEIGTAVDCWWNDGWWEGIISRIEACGKVCVYFPDENDFASFPISELRISKDWVDSQWVDIKEAVSISERFVTVEGSNIVTEGRQPVPRDSTKHETCAVQTTSKATKDQKMDTDSSAQVSKLPESGQRASDYAYQKNTQAGLPRSFLGEQLDIYRDKENKSARPIVTSNGVNLKVSRKRHREADASISARSENSSVIGRRDPMSTLPMDHLQGREINSSDAISLNKKKASKRAEVKRPQHEQSKPINGTPVSGSLFSPVTLASLVMSR